MDFLTQPWPWYIAGPIIGLFIPFLLITANKALGISSSLRHACAACVPANIPFFTYDWKKDGMWNILFVVGVILGGVLGGYIFANPDPINLSQATYSDLAALGITDFTGLVPSEIFNWEFAFTLPGFIILGVGGFLVGFGARYAGGCTSGHAISGLSNLQLASLIAVIGFFAGGLIITHFIYPILF